MQKVFLSLGSNIGNRKNNLLNAINQLSFFVGKINVISSIYETEPWGNSNQRYFFNLALQIETDHEPMELLKIIQSIETKLGRAKSKEIYMPRKIDIDILFYNNTILTTNILKIPHPLIHERKFVLVPMTEIAPELIHPVLGKSMSQLLKLCDDQTTVEKIK